MKSLICTDDLATDVTGAEALIERHNEHRREIDARTNTFQVRLTMSVNINMLFVQNCIICVHIPHLIEFVPFYCI